MSDVLYHRRVIRVSAWDSPNVKMAQAQISAGQQPDDRMVVPGVLSWSELQFREATWDEVRKCIGLHGEFYEGAQLLLFPPTWLDRADEVARRQGNKVRRAKGVGIDPAEGGDSTCFCAVDEDGCFALESLKTPDTGVIPGMAIAFVRRVDCPWGKVCFDAGGGGKQHADALRRMGYPVQTVRFGENPSLEIKRVKHQVQHRRDMKEEKYVYKNLRAEMYHEASRLLDPGAAAFGKPAEFGLPCHGEPWATLRRQLAIMPKLTDEEGRYWLPPKDKKDANSKVKTIREMLGGASPDEADAFVMAVHAMRKKSLMAYAGAV